MTTGGILDHSEQKHSQKTEPSFDGATAAPAEMPAWLKQQPAAAAPSAARRWGERIVFLGVALLAMAAAGGLTLLGLDLYETYGSTDVVAANTPAQPSSGALPLAEKRSANLPPLVLLPQDGKSVPPQDAPLAAVPAPLIVVPPKPAPPAIKAPVKTAPAKLAAQAVAKPKPKPVADVKKPVVALKRPPAPAPVLAKVAPRAKPPVKGTPPRNLGRDPAFDDPPPAAAADRSCRPGELARECEARTR